LTAGTTHFLVAAGSALAGGPPLFRFTAAARKARSEPHGEQRLARVRVPHRP